MLWQLLWYGWCWVPCQYECDFKDQWRKEMSRSSENECVQVDTRQVLQITWKQQPNSDRNAKYSQLPSYIHFLRCAVCLVILLCETFSTPLSTTSQEMCCGSCFDMVCRILIPVESSPSFSAAPLALEQSYDCPNLWMLGTSEGAMKNTGK